ncbi:four helix bundle protein [Hoylesella pleuritidis]|uniref:four helix bundle protein n=1 Tax=Hoylesella pleuritidis TaxID=407975 RepID=UPI0028D36D57|nr:four helix bundle protein [Hoylesella pleuritidis]
MEPFYFRRLDVYRNAKQLSRLIYELLRKYPAEERFALCSQLRRAVTSIPINIAEGFGRFSSKEKAHFIEIAFGSVTEVLYEIELSLDEGYISQEEFKQVEERLSVIGKQLSGLHSSILRNGDSRIRER